MHFSIALPTGFAGWPVEVPPPLSRTTSVVDCYPPKPFSSPSIVYANVISIDWTDLDFEFSWETEAETKSQVVKIESSKWL